MHCLRSPQFTQRFSEPCDESQSPTPPRLVTKAQLMENMQMHLLLWVSVLYYASIPKVKKLNCNYLNITVAKLPLYPSVYLLPIHR